MWLDRFVDVHPVHALRDRVLVAPAYRKMAGAASAISI